MVENHNLKDYLEKNRYLRVEAHSAKFDLDEVQLKNEFLVFKSSEGVHWIIKDNKYMSSRDIITQTELLEKNIEFSLIKSNEEISKYITDIAISLNIFSLFIEEENLVYIDYDFNLSHFHFDLLSEVHGLSFVISGLENIKEKIIETKDSIFILHDQNTSKENLYYKYAYMSGKTQKKILIISYVLKDFQLELRQYEYLNATFNMIKSESYILNNFMLEKRNFLSTLESVVTINSFEVFPQANNFSLIYKTFDVLSEKEYTRKSLAAIIGELSGGIVDRQVSYYISAMLYLDLLIEPENGIYKLTRASLNVKQRSLKEQVEYLSLSILKQKIFYKSFYEYIDTESMPTTKKIAKIINEYYMFPFKESTALRRASTVRVWLEWIIHKLY